MTLKTSYKVKGLHCSEEARILKKIFHERNGVIRCDIDLLHAKIQIVYNPSIITSQDIADLIDSTGMKVEEIEDKARQKVSFWAKHFELIIVVLSGCFLFLGFLFHLLAHPDFWRSIEQKEEHVPFFSYSLLCYFLAIVIGSITIIPRAFRALKRFHLDIHLLIVIAVIGALLINQWAEAATVVFLFSLSLLLEHWSIERARRSVQALMELSPTLARVIDPSNHSLKEMKVEEISVGMHFLVRPGEKIPLDAVVLKGFSSVNQAPITGESLPVPKTIGDEVYAGTINEEGALECKVIREAKETKVAKILHLVQEAQRKRAKSQQWVEKFSRIYTPLMILLAFLIAVCPPLFFHGNWETWIYEGLVMLVIACPCALVISTPVSLVSALTSSFRKGILVKGGIFLELMSKIKAIAFDKTGTLTYGKPEVQKIVPLGKHSEKEVLEHAASLEKFSEHPIATAILKKAEEDQISLMSSEDFMSIKGKGAEGIINGKPFWIGSHRFMHERQQETDEVHQLALQLEDAGHSVVALGNQQQIWGLISVADSPREYLQEIMATLREEGVQYLVMLTGDNAPTAEALKKFANLDAFYAELLPEDKMSVIQLLSEKWKYVAMIGDGVNDAPAMAAAKVGIAMGAVGTDIAIETSDISLMNDDLSKIPWLIRHSKRTLKIIKQNISFSIGVKALFVMLAILGMATLWMAIAADTGASLLVIFNGLRLLKD